jgi:hypothetical protein
MAGSGDGLSVADLERRLSLLADRDLSRRLVAVHPRLYPRFHARRRLGPSVPFIVFPAAPKERGRVVRALIVATLVFAIGAACLYASAQARLEHRPALTVWANAAAVCGKDDEHPLRGAGHPCLRGTV